MLHCIGLCGLPQSAIAHDVPLRRNSCLPPVSGDLLVRGFDGRTKQAKGTPGKSLQILTANTAGYNIPATFSLKGSLVQGPEQVSLHELYRQQHKKPQPASSCRRCKFPLPLERAGYHRPGRCDVQVGRDRGSGRADTADGR